MDAEEFVPAGQSVARQANKFYHAEQNRDSHVTSVLDRVATKLSEQSKRAPRSRTEDAAVLGLAMDRENELLGSTEDGQSQNTRRTSEMASNSCQNCDNTSQNVTTTNPSRKTTNESTENLSNAEDWSPRAKKIHLSAGEKIIIDEKAIRRANSDSLEDQKRAANNIIGQSLQQSNNNNVVTANNVNSSIEERMLNLKLVKTKRLRDSRKIVARKRLKSTPSFFGRSLGSVETTECINNFDLEHLTKCLALALQNEIILSLAGPRPYTFDQIVSQMVPSSENASGHATARSHMRNNSDQSTREYARKNGHFFHSSNTPMQNSCNLISLAIERSINFTPKVENVGNAASRVYPNRPQSASYNGNLSKHNNNNFRQRRRTSDFVDSNLKRDHDRNMSNTMNFNDEQIYETLLGRDGHNNAGSSSTANHNNNANFAELSMDGSEAVLQDSVRMSIEAANRNDNNQHQQHRAFSQNNAVFGNSSSSSRANNNNCSVNSSTIDNGAITSQQFAYMRDLCHFVVEKCVCFMDPNAVAKLEQRERQRMRVQREENPFITPRKNGDQGQTVACHQGAEEKNAKNNSTALVPSKSSTNNNSTGVTNRSDIDLHWLNDIANRRTPNIWDIYNFLLEVMRAFQLEKEASVICLVYLHRFRMRSGVALTPDNWQKLVICSLMLSSKVFDDESYENADFAKLCQPLYTLKQINLMERIFVQVLSYDLGVTPSEYASIYFKLRTLGARDSNNANLLAEYNTAHNNHNAGSNILNSLIIETVLNKVFGPKNAFFWAEKYVFWSKKSYFAPFRLLSIIE